MTPEEVYEAGRYYIGLGLTAPFSWGLSEDLTIDIPARFRSFYSYRTTLGHKVNHAFIPGSNADFRVVKHPLFGPICCIGISEKNMEHKNITKTHNDICSREQSDH